MIRVLLFGMLADMAGERELEVPGKESMTLADILDHLQRLFPTMNDAMFLLAVNQQQTSDMNTTISNGDEVAIMPPFSGG